MCPMRRPVSPRPEDGGIWEIHYFYRASSAADAPGDTIIACDYRDNHIDRNCNVLLADGRVRLMREERFHEELAKPHNAAFAAALAKAEASGE